MRVSRKKHPEFGGVDLYAYPAHLRKAIANMPHAPGIYIFHGEEGDLPLYIGKSVNLRSRLLSHLRNEDEARMLRQARSVSYQRTSGEIGALLLEARLIKQMQPLYNQKLRRTRQLCSWQMQDSSEAAPELVYSKDVDFSSAPRLFGLFTSRRTAIASLQTLADAHRLCYARLGMEKISAGRGCFRSMLQHCAGVCCQKESPEDHDARLLSALEGMRVNCWPFDGAIGLIERWEDKRGKVERGEDEVESLVQVHAINQWSYLGSATTVDEARALRAQAAGFDADGYKILCKPLLAGGLEIVTL